MSEQRTEMARTWAIQYLTNPHPDLGRTGAVCPYMPRSVRSDYLTMRSFDATRGDAEFIELAHHMLAEMIERSAIVGSDRIYLVIMVVPYGLPDQDLRAMVERVHNAVRSHYNQHGYMAGDFWPDHEAKGLYNENFHPFASPVPMFGIRHMIPADLRFFVKQEPTARSRMNQLQRYRAVFEGVLSPSWARQLEEAEELTRRELATLEDK